MKFRNYITIISLIITGNFLIGQSTTGSFVYDEAGRLIQANLGDSTIISYQYDLGGNMILRSVEKQTTSIEQISSSAGIYLSPNPMNEILNISIPEDKHKDFSLRLVDALGKNFIMSQKGTLNSEGGIALTLSGLPSGTYILQLIIDQRMYVDKIIKM